MGIELSDEQFNNILYKLRVEKEVDLAAYQPRFLLEQVVASCRFMEQDPSLVPRFLNYAIDNLRVKRAAPLPDPADSAPHPIEAELERERTEAQLVTN